MTRKSVVCLALLFSAGCFLSCVGRAHGAKPEKLMRVTLDCEEARFRIVPLYCLGADVVNMGGRSKDIKGKSKRMTFDCLPGATIFLERSMEDSLPEGIVRFLPEDNGKIVHLRYSDEGWYKNGVPCSLDFSQGANGKDFAKQLAALKEARKNKKTLALTAMLNVGDAGAAALPVLQELKSTGAGLLLDTLPDEKSLPDGVFRNVCRAIGEVEPRLLNVDSRGLAALKDRLSTVETLILGVHPDDAVPDLSKLANLRHLLLVSEGGKGALELKSLAKLTQLKSLTVVVNYGNCSNAGAIGELANLQFLTMVSKTRCDPSIFGCLRNLRYLAAEFPPDMDFSLAEKIPDLQTLCILKVREKYNLTPLEKLPHLHCLAVSNGDEINFDARNFKNVREFQKARPDVEVVPYEGICLGSFWLLLAAAAAAVAAWLMRRRRIGSRLARQL
jgi:hypothetical protein